MKPLDSWWMMLGTSKIMFLVLLCCRSWPLTHSLMSRQEGSSCDAGTITGPNGQKVSNVFPAARMSRQSSGHYKERVTALHYNAIHLPLNHWLCLLCRSLAVMSFAMVYPNTWLRASSLLMSLPPRPMTTASSAS